MQHFSCTNDVLTCTHPRLTLLFTPCVGLLHDEKPPILNSQTSSALVWPATTSYGYTVPHYHATRMAVGDAFPAHPQDMA